MRIASAAVVVAALCGLGAPAFAHGGQYRGPTGQSPGGAPTPGTGGSGATPTTDWEAWWTANAWRFINLRERLRARDQGPEGTSTGGLGAHAGVQDGGTPEVRKDPREYFEKDVLPVLTEALEDQDAEVRSAAVVALGKLGFARSLHPLRKAMKDSVRDVRDGAVVALGMLGVPFVAEDLRAVLFDPKEPERTRSFAGIGLGLIGGEEGARPLMEYLDPASDGTREGGIHRTAHTEASALTGLGMSRFQAAIAPVRKDYDSGNRFEPTVRSFAAVALGRLGDHEAIPSLLLGLEFPREAMRQSAALALGMVATPADDAVVAALSKVLYQETDANTRQFALMSLARIGGDPARAAVRKYLEKGARIDIPLAALGCALGKDAAALPAVRKLYQEEKQPSVKGALALALGLYGDITVADELRRLSVAQGDRGLRIHCLTALGLMGDNASAGPALELLEKENDPAVKLGAATCLGLLKDRDVVGVLEKLVKSGDNVYIRSGACRLLGHVGSPSSAPVLIAVVKDLKDNSVVRMSATAALGNLGDRSLIPLLSQVSIDGNYASTVDPLIELASIM